VDYAIKRIYLKQNGLKLNGADRVLVCVDGVSVLGEGGL
jgi:hypothetical protein